MAKTGRAWLTTSTGSTIRRTGSAAAMTSAVATPAATPSARPSTVSSAVTPACGSSTGHCAWRVRQDVQRRGQHEGGHVRRPYDGLPGTEQAYADRDAPHQPPRPGRAPNICRMALQPPRDLPKRSAARVIGRRGTALARTFRPFAGMTRIRFEGFG